MVKVEQAPARIVLLSSGNYPGAGVSTLREGMARERNMREFSSGAVRRAFALAWQVFNLAWREDESTSKKEKKAWKVFQNLYRDVYPNPKKLYRLIMPYLGKHCPDEVLNKFTATQNIYAPDELFWDAVPELLARKEVNQIQPGERLIIEGKLAPILDVLTSEFPEHGLSILRLVLDVSIENSAYRVMTREIEKCSLVYPGIPYYPNVPEKVQLDLRAALMQHWWFDHSQVPESCDLDEMLAWKDEKLRGYTEENQRRIENDRVRYAKTFGSPADTFDLNQQQRGIIHIDANRPADQVLATALQIYDDTAPKKRK